MVYAIDILATTLAQGARSSIVSRDTMLHTRSSRVRQLYLVLLEALRITFRKATLLTVY
jgi:hypothetical protein